MSDGGNDSDSRLSSEAGTSTASGKGGTCTPTTSKRYHMGSDSSSSRSIDISHLEKDSEVLAKKAKKRLNRQSSSMSYETFLEKLIYWQRKRKIDKIKTLLETLFPKLKSSEEEVKHWLESVVERKETYYAHGRALIKDLEGQIQAHQHNLDFLDEAINDIKQIDYDIVKEISELKSAYHFNQEVLKRAEKTVRHSASSSYGSGSGRGTPRADPVNITGSEESNKPDQDIIHFDQDQSRILTTTPATTPHVPVSDPAVWQGIKECAPTKVHIATSPFTKSLSKLLLSGDSPRNSTSERPGSGSFSGTQSKLKESIYSNAMRERAPSPIPVLRDLSGKPRGGIPPPISIDVSSTNGKGARGGGSSRPSTPSSAPTTPTHSGNYHNVFVDDIKDSELVWGGAESKRRSLQSSAISVQAILTPASAPSQSKSSGGSGKNGNGRSKGEELPVSSIFKSPWSPTASSTSSPNNVNPSAVKSGHGGPLGIQGHHDPDGELRKSRSFEEEASKAGIADRRSPPPPDHGVSSSTSVTHNRTPVNLSTLLKKLPDELAVIGSDETDGDQIELCKRISKCRLLKDTLKPVLDTLQATHDEQALGLKKIKKMRIEMMNLFGDDEQSSRESNNSATGLLSGYTSSSQGSTIDHVNSHNSLVHLENPSHNPGSGSSGSDRLNATLEMEVSARPHTPPASHVSSNTLTFGTYLHQHHHNGNPLQHTSSPESAASFRSSVPPILQPGRLSDIDPCLHDVAGDYVADMKILLDEERDAKSKLAKLSSLIDSALIIDRQLSSASPSPKVV